MATRKQLWHPDKVRERIRTSQLINRLQNHALKSEEMTQTQLKAAEILLRKSLPDLTSIAHTGPAGGPVVVTRSDAEL